MGQNLKPLHVLKTQDCTPDIFMAFTGAHFIGNANGHADVHVIVAQARLFDFFFAVRIQICVEFRAALSSGRVNWPLLFIQTERESAYLHVNVCVPVCVTEIFASMPDRCTFARVPEKLSGTKTQDAWGVYRHIME
ncbi:hypothetical protein Lgee_0251 [Legionella geestiana]|uniref:Uncharacterized protein n=1 Tax=Legionella geestiana TaxID=45065 RepID=A0A0W0U959_9GAMM|nr:hypothetical protein Lgee_0251 [Legionella geestiana]STX53674.1 Uncharacterised protein [Legionella geestiana]